MREKGKQQRAERHVPVPVGHAWQRTPRTGNTLCRSERGERGEAFVGMCHVYLGQSMVHLSGPTNSLSLSRSLSLDLVLGLLSSFCSRPDVWASASARNITGLVLFDNQCWK